MEAVSHFVVVRRSCRVEIAEGVVGENERRRSLVPVSRVNLVGLWSWHRQLPSLGPALTTCELVVAPQLTVQA
jgi:hypothetical protein